MTDEQIALIVDGLLERSLEGYGNKRVTVRSGEDHDGEQALFVEISFDPRDKAWTGSKANAVQGEIWSALREIDETRFPYVRFVFQHGDSAVQLEERVRDLLRV